MKYLEFSKTEYKTFPAGFIFHGEDIFFLSEGVKKIKAMVGVENPELNIDIVDNYKSFFSALDSLPFLSENRLVIFTYADFSDKESIKVLKEYIKNPNPTSVFVITTDKPLKGKFDAELIDCSKENANILSKWVEVYARRNGKSISNKNAQELVSRCMCDMSKISKETEKLVLFVSGSEITNQHIEDCSIKEVEKIIFKLTDAIADKNGVVARMLLLEMQSEMTIFQMQSLLFKMFQRMFFIRTSQKSVSEIASVLGVKEYAVKVLSQKASKFSKLQLKNAVEYLEIIDWKIKSGNMNQNGCIEDMILHLMK
ncbi:MAG: DNA polymerase III subunit delta [Bacillota bacterium]